MERSAAHLSVCALLGRELELLQRAVAAQHHSPDAVVTETGKLAGALARALETGADWIWVLDGRAAPRPDALAALIRALDRLDGLPEPDVLAGVVLEAAGRVDRASAAWYRRLPTELAMAAVERRLLPIRATSGPLIVSSRAAAADMPPNRELGGAGTVLEWSARLLRGGQGYLVPESESDLICAPAVDPLRNPVAVARLVGGRAFTGLDRLRVAFDAADRALSVRREDPRPAP